LHDNTGDKTMAATDSAAFTRARDFLLAHRTDYDTAYRDFRWPQLTEFNWALDHFDPLAHGNDATALHIVEEDGRETRRSFASLSARSDQVANWLRAQGVKRGDRVLLMLGNELALWELMLACIKLGAVMIPATMLLTPEDLRDRVLPILKEAGFDTTAKSPEWLTQMAAVCQEKIKNLNEIIEYTDFFFKEPAQYEEKAMRKQWQAEGAMDRMLAIQATLESVTDWTHDSLKAAYEALVEKTGAGLGSFVHPTRLALTGKSVGPGLFELTELLGKEACMARVNRAIEFIKAMPEAQS